MARGAYEGRRRRWAAAPTPSALLLAACVLLAGGRAVAEDKVGGELRAWAKAQGAKVMVTTWEHVGGGLRDVRSAAAGAPCLPRARASRGGASRAARRRPHPRSLVLTRGPAIAIMRAHARITTPAGGQGGAAVGR